MSDPPVDPGSAVTIPPRRTDRLTPLITVVQQIWRVAIPMAFLVIAEGVGRVIVLPLLVVGMVVLGVAATIAWSRFTYAIEHGALIVESGLVNRQRREVPLGRVQQVDVRRSFVQRIFGLSALHVDTASSGSGAEVVLASLAEADAIALHRILLAHGRPAAAPPQAPPIGAWSGPRSSLPPPPGATAAPWGAPAVPARTLVSLGTRDLVVAALTGPALGVGVVFLLAFAGPIADVVAGGTDLGGGVAALAGLLFMAAALAVFVGGSAVVSTVLRDNDFTVERIGDDLRVRRGLLDQRETTLALHRIQCIRIVENPARRILGRCSLRLQNAGSGGTRRGNEQSSLDAAQVVIPVLPTAQLAALLDELLPGIGPLPPIEGAPKVARRRRLTRAGLVTALVLGPGLLVVLTGGPWGWLVPGVVAGTVAFALVGPSYRALGSGLGDDVVVARAGVLQRETTLIPMARLQSVRIRRSPLQARVGIGTLALDVAGRGGVPKVVDGSTERLVAIRAAALFDDSTRADERRARERTRRAVRLEVTDGITDGVGSRP
ncbi:MAG: PH domain-containing protein [Actinobacteria bacterium]|nr:PH domain-containing protein [Actinomycetota bacterium]